jgi:hypothetical protein
MTIDIWLRSTVLFLPAVLLVSGTQSLPEPSHSAGVLVGTAVRPSLFSEAAYSATLAHEFSMVEPEDVEVVGRAA